MSQDVDVEAELLVQQIRKDWNLEDRDPDGLYKGEIFWRDHQPWLLERGYKLRPRYQPSWEPSWKKSGRYREACEDGHPPKRSSLMDAVRLSDQSFVMLKLIHKGYHPHEIEIGQYLSTPAMQSDSRNHSVPLLDVLEVPDDSTTAIQVMPLLRKFNEPPFGTVGEVVDCISQAFQGLQFMHEHNIAHRDCAWNNYMMDPAGIFPVPYHPVLTDKTRDFRGKVHPLTRTQVPVKYYWIDFGLARHYQPDQRPPAERIIIGADKSPPEHTDPTQSCDPFPTDVYFVGNFVRQSFIKNYRNLDMLEGLVKIMVQDDPTKRPSMDVVVTDFNKLVKKLGQSRLRARLIGSRESGVETLARDLQHTVRSFFSRSASSRQVPS